MEKLREEVTVSLANLIGGGGRKRLCDNLNYIYSGFDLKL
jgi:hypothetical protein